MPETEGERLERERVETRFREAEQRTPSEREEHIRELERRIESREETQGEREERNREETRNREAGRDG